LLNRWPEWEIDYDSALAPTSTGAAGNSVVCREQCTTVMRSHSAEIHRL
jgi:hypothetical protein